MRTRGRAGRSACCSTPSPPGAAASTGDLPEGYARSVVEADPSGQPARQAHAGQPPGPGGPPPGEDRVGAGGPEAGVGADPARARRGEEAAGAEGHTGLGAAQAGVRPGHRGAARHRLRRPCRGGHLDGRRTPPCRDRPPARLPDRDRAPARQWLRAAGGPGGAGAGGRGAGAAAGDRTPHRGRARPGRQAAPVLGVGPAAAEGRGQAHRGPGLVPAGRDRPGRRPREAAVFAGSTRRPAGRAWCRWRSCSRTPQRRRSPTRSRCWRRPAAATGRRAGTTPSTRRRSARGTTARRSPSLSPLWSSSRSTAPTRLCGGGWDGRACRR